ncbi:Pore membrane protein, partial [Choanephora cucurbitarum]
QGQFYWWLGHIFVLFNGLVYFSSILSFHTNPLFYKRAFASVFVSYSTVLYHIISTKNPTFKMLLSNQNMHYLIMAFYWYSSTPIAVTLVPFFLSSLVHCIAYIQSELISRLPDTSLLAKDQLSSYLQQWIQRHYKSVKQWIAYTEVVFIPAYLIIHVILWRVSILALIVYSYFLQSRYTQSTEIQATVHQTVDYLDSRLLNKHQPALITNVYSAIKQLVVL